MNNIDTSDTNKSELVKELQEIYNKYEYQDIVYALTGIRIADCSLNTIEESKEDINKRASTISSLIVARLTNMECPLLRNYFKKPLYDMNMVPWFRVSKMSKAIYGKHKTTQKKINKMIDNIRSESSIYDLSLMFNDTTLLPYEQWEVSLYGLWTIAARIKNTIPKYIVNSNDYTLCLEFRQVFKFKLDLQ